MTFGAGSRLALGHAFCSAQEDVLLRVMIYRTENKSQCFLKMIRLDVSSKMTLAKQIDGVASSVAISLAVRKWREVCRKTWLFHCVWLICVYYQRSYFSCYLLSCLRFVLLFLRGQFLHVATSWGVSS